MSLGERAAFAARLASLLSRDYSRRSARLLLRESELPIAYRHADGIARPELAAQNPLRQRVLHLLLDGTLQRPGAVHRVEPGLAEQVARLVIERELDVPFEQALAQVLELDVDDAADLLHAERAEHDDVVDAVDELRPEVLLHDLHDGRLHLLILAFARELLDDLRAE